MHPLFVVRAKAHLHDCRGYALIALATVPVGVVAQRRGWLTYQRSQWMASTIPPVAATLLAARREATTGATPGKRGYGLRVDGRAGAPAGLARALVRNVLKIGLPWQLGHTVAIGAAHGGFDHKDRGLIATSIATYGLVGALAVSSGVRSGRGLHDRLAGTTVRRA